MHFSWLIFFLLGSIINTAAYFSVGPVLISILFLSLALVPYIKKGVTHSYQRKAIVIVFSICWFWAGIAAIYAEFLNDPSQLIKDASNFYKLSIQDEIEPGLLSAITEGYGAVLVWQYIYKFTSTIGFDNGRYIGILVNVLLVSYTSAIGISIIRCIYGVDRFRFNQFILLFSLCGIFWLFSAILLRDAFVLFFVAILLIYWIKYLTKRNLRNFFILVVVSISHLFIFPSLRYEFFYVPFALAISAFLSFYFYNATDKRKNKNLVFLFLLLSASIFIFYYGQTVDILERNHQAYIGNNDNTSSFAIAILDWVPTIIFPLVAIGYLYIFPIPFWSGLQLESIYHLFVSFNSIFMYFTLPLLGVSVVRLIKYRYERTITTLFLAFSFFGFSLGVAVTSIEIRHLGPFLLMYILLAVTPDYKSHVNRIIYKKFLINFLFVVTAIHALWAVVKFVF